MASPIAHRPTHAPEPGFSGTSRRGLGALAGAVALALAASQGRAQSTAFTYQGVLKQSGQPATGTYDFQFRLFDAASGGTQLGGTACLDNVQVAAGQFTAQIDFGQQFASPIARYLELAVRPDTGLGCAIAAGFTLLSRQPLTATPLADHAKAAYALDAPDGSPTSAVYVDSAGQVGIGTTTPGTGLTVAANMELGTASSDYRHFRIGGGNSDGFLYGSYPALADGIHLGYNFYADAAGASQIIHTDGGTSRISTGYGVIALATAPAFGGPPINRLTVDPTGAVKVGTQAQYFVPGGEENLRIIRGVITAGGGTIVGSGFQAVRTGTGQYTINFNTAFAGAPAVTATADASGGGFIPIVNTLGATSQWVRFVVTFNGPYADAPIHFIAIGPR